MLIRVLQCPVPVPGGKQGICFSPQPAPKFHGQEATPGNPCASPSKHHALRWMGTCANAEPHFSALFDLSSRSLHTPRASGRGLWGQLALVPSARVLWGTAHMAELPHLGWGGRSPIYSVDHHFLLTQAPICLVYNLAPHSCWYGVSGLCPFWPQV